MHHQPLQTFGYIPENCKVSVGEVLDITTTQVFPWSLVWVSSLLLLGIFALLQEASGNDDDDSDSGNGGLMQPI